MTRGSFALVKTVYLGCVVIEMSHLANKRACVDSSGPRKTCIQYAFFPINAEKIVMTMIRKSKLKDQFCR